jgi:chromosome segregation ATPase
MRRTKMVVLVAMGVIAIGCDRYKRTQETNVDRAPSTANEQTAQAQETSEQALEQARKAQEEATKQQDQVAKAERVRAEKSEAMQKAEAELTRERQEAQQAQRQAQKRSQDATQAAQQAQARAIAAQQEASRTMATGTTESGGGSAVAGSTTAEGTVTQIDREHLVLDRANGPDLHVKITQQVAVSGNNETGQAQGSIEDVAVGTPVRVKYHLEANQPVADRIELASTGSTIR